MTSLADQLAAKRTKLKATPAPVIVSHIPTSTGTPGEAKGPINHDHAGVWRFDDTTSSWRQQVNTKACASSAILIIVILFWVDTIMCM
jgi:hypothetical protein